MNEEKFKFVENNKKLLESNNWVFDFSEINSARNIATGCNIKGANTLEFLIDIINELDESFDLIIPNDEALAKMKGYSIICLSPFEIAKEETREFYSGECASWLLQNFRLEWLSNNKK